MAVDAAADTRRHAASTASDPPSAPTCSSISAATNNPGAEMLAALPSSVRAVAWMRATTSHAAITLSRRNTAFTRASSTAGSNGLMM